MNRFFTSALFDQMNHILKNAPTDRTENIKTYNNPTLPLTPGLATAIAHFVKATRTNGHSVAFILCASFKRPLIWGRPELTACRGRG